MLKTCPKCKQSGDVAEMFGYRNHANKLRPQSWCRKCRNAKLPEIPLCVKCGDSRDKRFLKNQNRYHSWCRGCEKAKKLKFMVYGDLLPLSERKKKCQKQ